MSQRFTKIIHRENENETEIVLPTPHVQKCLGFLLFLIGLGNALMLCNVNVLIHFGGWWQELLSAAPWFLFAAIFLFFAKRIYFGRPRLIIGPENIQFESDGYFRKRKKTYPRSDFVRTDRNFVLESRYSPKHPTLEFQLEHDTIEIDCADSEEQTEIELLLREIFSATENEPKSFRGFFVQIQQEDKKLVLEQPPQKKDWALAFLIFFCGAGCIMMSIEIYHNPPDLKPLWITVSSFLPIIVLLVILVFIWVKVSFGRTVYTFERRTLTIDFRCPGFHRQWIYYYSDIQSVKPDQISSNRGGKIDRCVAIKVPWKTFRISVRSEDEQQYICTLIRQFIGA